MERDQRIVTRIEEVAASQGVILHAASGIHAGRLSLDV
jgi:hypothetical protein